jgi:hypothetical protein
MKQEHKEALEKLWFSNPTNRYLELQLSMKDMTQWCHVAYAHMLSEILNDTTDHIFDPLIKRTSTKQIDVYDTWDNLYWLITTADIDMPMILDVRPSFVAQSIKTEYYKNTSYQDLDNIIRSLPQPRANSQLVSSNLIASTGLPTTRESAPYLSFYLDPNHPVRHLRIKSYDVKWYHIMEALQDNFSKLILP